MRGGTGQGRGGACVQLAEVDSNAPILPLE